jgi:alkylation response protein AidB-like acyl-CoA dehydrogenase
VAVICLDEILQRVRAICAKTTGPQAEAVDRDALWPAETIHSLQQQKIAGLTIPEESGGLGHGMLALIKVCELLGRESPSAALCFGMHCVGAAVISAKATPEQKTRYLEPIARGEHLTSLALSEPGSGIQFWFPEAKLVPEMEGGFRLHGVKAFVTNGGHADSYVVSACAADPSVTPQHFSCAVVSNDAEGLSWGPRWSGTGMRGNSSCEMKLGGLRIAPTDLLGKEGDQIWYVFNVITPFFIAAMTGTYLGAASAAVDLARSRIAERTYSHGGAAPAHSPVVLHRLGALWASVERSRCLAYEAARTADCGGTKSLELLFSAKAEVGDCAVAAAGEAMTFCGGRDYRAGGALERNIRDVQAVHLMSPTTDLLRIWTGRALLGLPILGD